MDQDRKPGLAYAIKAVLDEAKAAQEAIQEA